MKVPPSIPVVFEPDKEKAGAVLATALRAGAGWLDPIAAQELLSAYGIAVAKMARASTAKQAAEHAAAWDAPVALKIDSPDITHKSDLGASL